jgi:hypothetical protein
MYELTVQENDTLEMITKADKENSRQAVFISGLNNIEQPMDMPVRALVGEQTLSGRI